MSTKLRSIENIRCVIERFGLCVDARRKSDSFCFQTVEAALKELSDARFRIGCYSVCTKTLASSFVR
ncbi:hypothetical protein EPI10_006123 [Gossypium australe]|uniref:Uncharacterized protein n=1 Tax=Gossypium australe TaxID=47621 RepID=A0A5B6WRK2_9ROSI|nr:hypothetical protein EPI10_006123 [Gossypium australe]